MSTITFMPANVAVEYSAGESIFEAGGRARVGIDTACVGKGTCGLCRVRIVAGAESLNEYTDEELKHLGNVYFLTKIRLSCRTQLSEGDVVVELAPAKRKKTSKKDDKQGQKARTGQTNLDGRQTDRDDARGANRERRRHRGRRPG